MEHWIRRLEIEDLDELDDSNRSIGCPDESWYWLYMDGEPCEANIQKHLESCPFCLNQLNMITKSLLSAETKLKDPVKLKLPQLTKPLPNVKVVLKALGSSILEIFNPLQTISEFRGPLNGPLVLQAKFDTIALTLEAATYQESLFHLVCRVSGQTRNSIIYLDLSDERGLLRSMAVTNKKNVVLGEWPVGIYTITVRSGVQVMYALELQLQ
jgi:hypothetical protein